LETFSAHCNGMYILLRAHASCRLLACLNWLYGWKRRQLINCLLKRNQCREFTAKQFAFFPVIVQIKCLHYIRFSFANISLSRSPRPDSQVQYDLYVLRAVKHHINQINSQHTSRARIRFHLCPYTGHYIYINTS